MAKRKTFKVRVEGKTYELTGYAQVILSESDTRGWSGNYSHPRIKLTMAPGGSSNEWDQVTVWIEFQRNALTGDHANDKPASGVMDTRKPWSVSYGGHVALSTDGERIALGRKHRLSTEDKVREAVSVAIGHEQTERNIHALTECECERAIKALEYLGAPIEMMYQRASGGPPEDLRSAVAWDERANYREARAEREAREQARAKDAEQADGSAS